MEKRHSYGTEIPNLDISQLRGALLVVEGGDGAGRSTQVSLLRNAIERLGYPTTEFGLKRSRLVGEELTRAMKSNVICPRTLGLFYATDFADQLERVIMPALRSGFVVVADRYIYTLMARDMIRGADPEWIRSVFSFALRPDLTFYLRVSPKILAQRTLLKSGCLNYWESGMDIQRSGDMHECFIYYQNRLWQQFHAMTEEFGFNIVNGNRDVQTVHTEIFEVVKRFLPALFASYHSEPAPAPSPRRIARV